LFWSQGHVIFNGTDNEQPRELNGLIKVYGKHSLIPGIAPRSTLPPIGMQKSSESILMEQKQLETNRVGLAKDKDDLNIFTALPPITAKKQSKEYGSAV